MHPDLAHLLQLLGYLLHDADDDHHIDTISLYQARDAHLATWTVDDLLADLAGHPVHLGGLRTDWATLIQSGPP